ncbi:MAG: hypothetical protein C3F02_03025 [Parcubacteria group bacterium]|nr:MAG: hypothetical protein C3F02_03025 [Parcubacteria group bacterium]
MLLADRRGVAVVEVAAQVVVVPVPLLAIPVEIADAQVAVGAAVDGTPEVGVLSFPLLGNELGIFQIPIQEIGIEDRLALELLTEIVAYDPATVLLPLGEVEADLGGIKLQLPTTDVLLDLPAVRHEGVGVEVDDVFGDDDLGQAVKQGFDVDELRVLTQQSDFCRSKILRLQSVHQLMSLTLRIRRHVFSPFWHMCLDSPEGSIW